MKHIFIINPTAGKKDATARIRNMAQQLHDRHGLDCVCQLTEHPHHAAELARAAAESGEEVRLYACGGDGTLHEVVNGAAGYENAAVTCIPVGTGNDFLKNFGTDAEKFTDAENLWNGDVCDLDLIDCNGKLCLTIACTGVDAQVAEDVHKFGDLPLLSGKGNYLLAVAVNFLLRKISQRWTVSLDGETFTGDFAVSAVCNGRYYGGGFNPIPQARMYDGVLNTILIRKISHLTFARLIGKYSKGQHEKLTDWVRLSNAREIRISTEDGTLPTGLDGECFHSNKIVLTLSDKKLRFFGPAGCSCNATAKGTAVHA